jgi:formylglycine-generating enzyme required for sulfatase activity/ankyrin repeat protein
MAFARCKCGFSKNNISDEHIGKMANCPKCREVIVVQTEAATLPETKCPVDQNKLIEQERIQIPGGDFLMGSTVECIREYFADLQGWPPSCIDGERPKHTVNIDTFEIDKYPVTCGMYHHFCQETGYQPPSYWEGPAPPDNLINHPVVYVTLRDAMAYCKWAGGRLPYETEWEKAARGTDDRTYPWGNEFDVSKANVDRDGDVQATTPVNAHPQGASPYGAMDMVGNVHEWTRDVLTPYPGYTEEKWSNVKAAIHMTHFDNDGARTDPVFFPHFSSVRGGSFRTIGGLCRCASRIAVTGDAATPDLGFRCVYAPDPNETVISLMNQGDARGALPYVKKALNLSPAHAGILFNAAYCFQSAGEYQQALQLWQQLVDLWPNDQDAIRLLQECKQHVGASSVISAEPKMGNPGDKGVISQKESIQALRQRAEQGDADARKELEAMQVVGGNILEAIKKGDMATVKYLLDKQPELVNLTNEGGNLLCLSLDKGFANLEMAKLLILSGADVRVPSRNGYTPLHLNSFSGNVEMAELLIARGADVAAVNPNDGSMPHHLATMTGKTELVDFLLSKGAPINAKEKKYGLTALNFAAWLGHTEIIKLLLAKGADTSIKDARGRTPMEQAIQQNRPESVRVLTQHLEDAVSAGQEKLNEQLFKAVEDDDPQQIRELLRQGANHGAKDNQGNTPLHIAAFKEHLACCAALIEGGANTLAKNYTGQTPIQYAEDFQNRFVASMGAAFGGMMGSMSADLQKEKLQKLRATLEKKSKAPAPPAAMKNGAPSSTKSRLVFGIIGAVLIVIFALIMIDARRRASESANHQKPIEETKQHEYIAAKKKQKQAEETQKRTEEAQREGEAQKQTAQSAEIQRIDDKIKQMEEQMESMPPAQREQMAKAIIEQMKKAAQARNAANQQIDASAAITPFKLYWSAARGYESATVAVGERISSDRAYRIVNVSGPLTGSTLVRRRQDQIGNGLAGEVVVSKHCTMFVAVMTVYRGNTVLDRQQLLKRLEGTGMSVLGYEFLTTTTPGERWEWTVVSKEIGPGPVTFDLLPSSKVFMFKDLETSGAATSDRGGEQVSYTGTWTGEDQKGYHVAKIVINKDTFPCRGEVVTQYGRGQMFVMNVNWTYEEGKVVGTLAEGVKTTVAEVRLEANQLFGKVTSLIQVDGVKDLTFFGFVKKPAGH